MSFQIIRNDITKVEADAIVNTANPKPIYVSGTDLAIYQAAGADKLLAERTKIGEIPRGESRATPAFALKAKYIIHTVGPIWKGGSDGEFDTLRACYENSLNLARELGCRSIAFPLIATGVYGFPKDKALQIAMSVIQPFVMEHEMDVILVVFDQKAFVLSGKVVDKVREYVDSNYVDNVHKELYRPTFASSQRRQKARDAYKKEAPNPYEEAPKPHRPSILDQKKPQTKEEMIKAMLAAQDKTFQQKLFEIIDERGLTGPQVYKGYISKQVYSKIQADENYHPNKFTALALCLSLHLDLDQTMDLIGRAGWTLSPSSKADLVVKGAILNKTYNLVEINILLYDFGCAEIEKIK